MRQGIRRAVAAGITVWWTNSVLAGITAPDVAITHVSGEVLLDSHVAATAGATTPLSGSERTSWPLAWGRLRGHGCRALRLVLPVPGDPLGMPGPATTTKLAIKSGAALVCDDAQLALLPQEFGFWRAYPIDVGMPEGGLGTVAEARREMRESMMKIAQAFNALEPDQIALDQIRAARTAAPPAAPPGVDPRAAQLAASAIQVWGLMEIAADAAERAGRPVRELTHLNHTARRALSVAFSAKLTT